MTVASEDGDAPDRGRLMGRLAAVAPQLATDGVFLHQAIAGRLGVSATDLRCLEAVSRQPSTVGELGQITGLATGATTRMVDRLEQAGFVRRRADPADRRRVIVTPVPERVAELDQLFEGISLGWRELLERYSDEELALLLDFLERVHRMSVEQIARAGGRPD
jgi:DNA-binding MarR family transcriptional regulator